MKGMGVMVMVIVAVVMAAVGVSGQTPTPACASKLIPCQDSLNSTTPSSGCCSSLKEAVEKELPCLCSLFNDRDLFKALNINITQALDLPKHCGITQGVDACRTTTNGTAPAPTAGAPPGTPGGDSDAGRLAWAGASMLTGLLLLWASVLVHA